MSPASPSASPSAAQSGTFSEPPKEKTYRILKLTASNVKRLKAVEVLPSGDIVTVGGKNDAGKSSILDSIQYAMAGAGTICERPIRDGQSKAVIVIDLGDLVITKTFTSAGAPTLKVTTKEGSPLERPAGYPAGFAGVQDPATIPLAFSRAEPAKQLETMRKLVQLDFTDIDRQRATLYDQRTNVNRDVQNARLPRLSRR